MDFTFLTVRLHLILKRPKQCFAIKLSSVQKKLSFNLRICRGSGVVLVHGYLMRVEKVHGYQNGGAQWRLDHEVGLFCIYFHTFTELSAIPYSLGGGGRCPRQTATNLLAEIAFTKKVIEGIMDARV